MQLAAVAAAAATFAAGVAPAVTAGFVAAAGPAAAVESAAAAGTAAAAVAVAGSWCQCCSCWCWVLLLYPKLFRFAERPAACTIGDCIVIVGPRFKPDALHAKQACNRFYLVWLGKCAERVLSTSKLATQHCLMMWPLFSIGIVCLLWLHHVGGQVVQGTTPPPPSHPHTPHQVRCFREGFFNCKSPSTTIKLTFPLPSYVVGTRMYCALLSS